jgi:integrase
VKECRAFFRMDLSEEKPAAIQFESNRQILDAWRENSTGRLSPTTLHNYSYEVAKFLEVWGDLIVTELDSRRLWAYLSGFGSLCKNLTRRNQAWGVGGMVMEPYCGKGLPLANCGPKCPSYGAMQVATVEKHLNAVITLFDFLVQRDAAAYNFVRDVKRQWIKSNKHRRRFTPKQPFTKGEVELLVNKSQHLVRRTMYLIMAKCGTRVGETVRLTMDKELYQPRKGWIEIPDFQGKRRGNRILVVDDQLLMFLEAFEGWREAKLERLGVETNALLINHYGQPFTTKKGNNTVNKHLLRSDMVRLGIEEKDAPPKHRRNSHSFRHFFSNHLELESKATRYWWNVLRGDIPKGNQRTYVHPKLEDLIQAYNTYGPRFQLNPV